MRRPRALSLRGRLLLLVLLAALPALLIIFYIGLAQREAATTEADRRTRNLVHLAIKEQEHLVTRTRQLLAGLAEHPAVADREQAERCQRLLPNILKLHPYYTNFGVAGRDGEIYCSGQPLRQRVNIADRHYFRKAVATGDFSIGEYQVGRVTGKSAINMGYPIHRGGAVAGVVYVALDLSWLEQLLSRTELPAGSMLAIVDRQGTVLAYHPEPHRWVGKTFPDSPLTRAVLANPHGGSGNLIGPDNISRLTAYAPLESRPGNAVYVIAGLATDIVYSEARTILAWNLALLGLAALALVAAWMGTNVFVIRRVNALAEAAGRLGRGELGARTGISHEGDELARLASAFDRMAEGLERRQAEVRRSTRVLRTLSAGNRSMLHARDEQSLLEAMCQAVVHVGGYRMAWVAYAQDDAARSVHPVAQEGLEEGLGPLRALNVSWGDNERGRGPAGTAIRTGAPVVMRDIVRNPRMAPWRDHAALRGCGAITALPLVVEGRAIGALVVCAAEPDAFDENEIRLLQEMSEDLSYGVAALRTRARHEEAASTIRRLAYFDALTELPNHVQLEQRFQETAAEAAGGAPSVALLLIDLKRFRDINEALGMHQANLLLKAIAVRLRDILNPDEFIARMRGDEFAVLASCADTECAGRIAERVRKALDERFTIGELSLGVDICVGVALCPDHGREIEALTRSADMALQHAKRSGIGWALYDHGQDQNTARRLALAADLREAIQSGGLILHYQPKVDMRTGRLCGVEALARWHHPQHGTIRPDEFIALAEHTGLIGPLTEWVVETAVRQVRAWKEAGLHLPVAVNLSARNLLDATLPEKIRALCAKWGIGKGLFELEITESMIMADPARSLALVTRLHKLGIPLYIDDFGTGYSSLGYLKRLPVDAIKIDKSFVIDMLKDRDSATIVRTIISLAHELGLRVVAEGVESEAMWKRLRAHRCDMAQGYFLGKPLDATGLGRLAREWRRPSSGKKRVRASS